MAVKVGDLKGEEGPTPPDAMIAEVLLHCCLGAVGGVTVSQRSGSQGGVLEGRGGSDAVRRTDCIISSPLLPWCRGRGDCVLQEWWSRWGT